MTDIALFHVATHKAGEPGYYAPRPRGHLEVRHDSKRYIYDIRGLHVSGREARAFIAQAWDVWPGEKHIDGRFPVYEVN